MYAAIKLHQQHLHEGRGTEDDFQIYYFTSQRKSLFHQHKLLNHNQFFANNFMQILKGFLGVTDLSGKKDFPID